MQYNLGLQTPDELKNWLMDQPKSEGSCPCCGRFTKIYKRHLHAQIIARLIKLYKIGGAYQFVHTGNLVIGSSSSDFTTAKYWGLIYDDKSEPKGGAKTSGQWRLTIKGVSFIKGDVRIPSTALVLFDKAIGFEGELLDIQECLAEGGFDYQKLMEAA